ncbi:MAG TPA: FecR domain-containing protein [Terriglobales bacterium]|nr:FecR domain-containing protein [Terriglobales bacterium]
MSPESEMFPTGGVVWLDALQWHRMFSETPEAKLTSAEIRGWQQWLAEPEHQRVFDQISRLLANQGRYRHRSLPAESEYAKDDYDISVPIAEWRQKKHSSPPSKSPRLTRKFPSLTLSAVAGLAGAAALTGFLMLDPRGSWHSVTTRNPALYQTGAAQVKDVHLPDGSTVVLGAKTELLVDLTRKRRLVTLVRGEAWFQDAFYKDWPFIVAAGARTIRAIGTSFVVDRATDRVVVTVTQGTVAVSPRSPPNPPSPIGQVAMPLPNLSDIRLSRGEQFTYRQDGTANSVTHADAKAATAWARGQLLFQDQLLSDVVEAINRYSVRRIVVSPAAGKLRFTGLVFATEILDWLQDLNQIFPVAVEQQGAEICIHMQSSGASPHESGPNCGDG